MEKGTLKILTLTLEKLGITKVAHLWNNKENTWRSFEAKLEHTCNIPPKIKDLVTHILKILQEATSMTTTKEVNPDLWSWVDGTPSNGTFMLANQHTYLVLLS